MDMASKLNIDTISNAMIRKKLGLSNIGEHHLNIFPTEVLERYFGEYSLSAKGYRTRDIPNPFFREIAKFLLDTPKYPKIPDVAHEFTARLQFGSSFEVMDFLEGQQIKLSQRMAKEHGEM